MQLFRDFSKIEIQGFILKFEKRNLRELISEALKEIGSVVIDKGFIVFLEVPEDFVVWCDKDQIIKVINNIILNAIKFTPKDCTIQISTEEWMNETLKISIKDNGIGLEKENLIRIFEQYTKVDPNSEGSGLGLAVVKSIVEAHGGEVWAESEGLNKGSTFSFTLPKTKAALKSIQTQQEAELSQSTE